MTAVASPGLLGVDLLLGDHPCLSGTWVHGRSRVFDYGSRVFRGRSAVRLGMGLLVVTVVMGTACTDDDDAEAPAPTSVSSVDEPACDEDAQVAALEQALAQESNGDPESLHRRIADAAADELIEFGQEGLLDEACRDPDVRLRTAVMLRHLAGADEDVRELFDEGFADVGDDVWSVAERLADAWYAAEDVSSRRQIGDAMLIFTDGENSEISSLHDEVDVLEPAMTQGLRQADVEPIRRVMASIDWYLISYLEERT